MKFRTPAFIAYLTAGDGGMDYSLQAALALEKGGVDLLEIGIPFSDPVADGPVIQKAMERSLKAGTTPEMVLSLIREIRKHSSIPVVLFSYYNPIFIAGESFLKRAKEAGVDGILIVDLPVEEDTPILDRVLLVSPSTSDERMEQIAQKAKGFIYYVCQKGTTGARQELPEAVKTDIARIKKYTSLPVVAGFGISNKKTAEMALSSADGFVVGSLFVDAIGRKVSPEELTQLARSIDPR